MMTTIWKALNSYNGKKFIDIGRYAVLILNRPITLPEKYVIDLWNEASFCATADGGTERWYEFLSSRPGDSAVSLKKIHPDLVSGDFDSITPETLQKCKEHNVKIVKTPDQDKTDFTKALEEIFTHTNGEIDSVVAVVDHSGRLDHIMSNLNTLFETHKFQLYLLGSESLTWLLKPGSNQIHIPISLVDKKATCGLIPLGNPCIVTTTGLKWNLDKETMQFGGLVSSCNTYSEDCECLVTVETDHPLLWTMSLYLQELL